MANNEFSIYRAVTGKGFVKNGIYVHSGVLDDDLKRKGLFCSNFSYAQYESSKTTGIDQKVPGLPIFLNFDEAVYWLKDKYYENLPVIIEAKIPLEFLGESSKIKIVRNYSDKVYAQELTLDIIKAHITGQNKIEGEAFIQNLKNTDKITLVFYRPNKIDNGQIVISSGFNKF